MAEKNSHEEGKRKEDLLNYHSANAASEWQLSEGLMPGGDPEPSCSNANIIEAFSPAMWDQQPGSSNLGFSDNGVQQNSGFLNPLDSRGSHVVPMRPGAEGSLGALGWIPPNAMLKGGMLVPGAPGFVPQSLAHFPADVGFIERAARYSCFSGGNFSEIMSPFNFPESMNSYSRNLAPLLGSQEAMAGNGLKLSMSGLQSLNNRMNMAADGLNSISRIPSHSSDMNLAASSKGVPIPAEHASSDGNQFKNENKNESLVPSNDEAKGNLRASSNDSDRGEFSGRGAQEEPEAPGLESSSKGSGSKKRKRLGQNPEHDQNSGKTAQVAEVRKEDNEVRNPTSITSKPTGKTTKQGPEASDSAKEDYIHIRARRGQATNSHSLAERVRREKISERMKFLQDLVPGCSKVTGKAVMLDEIINYVQSLQRQVEFLSMKLATVNPRLEFNIEGLLSKEILQSHGGPSPLTFPPGMSMAYASLQQGLHQSNLLHELGNSSEALRKSISSQFAAASGSGTFKDHSTHVSNVWEDELHNIVQMGLNSTDVLSSQDLSGMRSSHLALFSEPIKDSEMSKGSSSRIHRASSATWTHET